MMACDHERELIRNLKVGLIFDSLLIRPIVQRPLRYFNAVRHESILTVTVMDTISTILNRQHCHYSHLQLQLALSLTLGGLQHQSQTSSLSRIQCISDALVAAWFSFGQVEQVLDTYIRIATLKGESVFIVDFFANGGAGYNAK